MTSKPPRDSAAMVRKIQRHVGQFYGVSLKKMNGPRRFVVLVKPRFVAQALSYDLTGLPMHSIAYCFGRMCHGSILHAVNTMVDWRAQDPTLDREYQQLKKEILE